MIFNKILTSIHKFFFILITVITLAACGGGSDYLEEVIDRALEIDIKSFSISSDDVYPGESIDIDWRTDTALSFSANIYLSEDNKISNDDIKLVEENCDFDNSYQCNSGKNIHFTCTFQNDNSFNCENNGSILKENDLSIFLNKIPKNSFIILELCDDSQCDSRIAQLEFL